MSRIFPEYPDAYRRDGSVPGDVLFRREPDDENEEEEEGDNGGDREQDDDDNKDDGYSE